MFKSLFKPKWQHSKPLVRIEAIARFSIEDAQQRQILEQMARHDAEADVRAAALQALRDVEVLVGYWQHEADNRVRDVLAEHLLGLIGPDLQPAPSLGSWLAGLEPARLSVFLQRTRNVRLAEQALSGVSDPHSLRELATGLPLAGLRQAAARAIDDPAVLEALARDVRSKDKSVYRIARDKLDALKQAQQMDADTGQKLEEICAAMEAHARLPIEPLYVARFEHLDKQWQRLSGRADAALVQRYNVAHQVCHEKISHNQAEILRLQQQEEDLRQAAAERNAACEQFEDVLRLVNMPGGLERIDLPALSALLVTQKNRWEDAARHGVVNNAERQRFQALQSQLEQYLNAAKLLQKNAGPLREAAMALIETRTERLHELADLKRALDQAVEGIQWPEGVQIPELWALCQRALAQYHDVHGVLQKAEQALLDAMARDVRELQKEIERGNLKAANGLLRQCQLEVKKLPMNKAQSFQRQLRELTVKLNELRDWQGYATLPKKEALCEAMEALVGAEADPQALANRIRRLQEEWRMLGNTDAERSNKLWERFSAAADQAYEPCRVYFDTLGQVRESNLQARQNLCAQLDDYLQQVDWTQADWRAAREIFELSKQEWRQYSPVERKAGRDVQNRFNNLLQTLQSRLEQEFDKNLSRRQALISEAESLRQAEDIHHAIERAKQLQRDWKVSGMVSPREDGKLWKQFRAACDDLFARRDQKRAGEQAERDRHLAEAEAICDQIGQLAETVMFDPDAAEEQYRQLQEQFQQLGALPREQVDPQRKRYRAVTEAFARNLARARKQSHSRRFDGLWQLAEWFDEQEAGVLSGEAFAGLTAMPVVDDLPAEATPFIQLRARSLQGFVAGSHESAQILDANSLALRELCLRLEIGLEADSPAEDQQYRMQFQIARFNSGAAQRDKQWSLPDLLTRLQLEWLATGPVRADERQRYGARFRHLLQTTDQH